MEIIASYSMITTLEKYQHSITEVENNLTQQDLQDEKNGYRKDYLFFLAIVNLYFGNNTYTKKETEILFKNYLLQREISLIDKKTDIKILFDTITVSGDTSCIKKKSPHIYCSFHFGSFITAIPYLINEGVELFVVSQNEYLINEVATYSEMNEHKESKINSISNKNWDSLLNISNKLKEGKSVFVYIDRLEGINVKSREKFFNLIFFNHELLIRRGIPEISYLRKVPIISVVCLRKSTSEIEIAFRKHEFSYSDLSKQAYVSLMINDLFNLLSEYIKVYPEQWDYWLDLFYQLDLEKIHSDKKTVIHKFKNFLGIDAKTKTGFKPMSDNDIVLFNEEEYGFYVENDIIYLFNLKYFTCFKVSTNLYNIINIIKTSTMNFGKLKRIMNPSLLDDLIVKKVIQ